MSDDDDENARLRAMRSVAMRMDARGGAAGGGGGGLQALLDRQRRAQQHAAASRSSAFYEDDAGHASKKPRVAQPAGRQEGKPEPLVLDEKDDPADDEEAMLRAMLPGGFGAVKPGVKRAADERQRVLATQSRPAEGPTRPPPPAADDERLNDKDGDGDEGPAAPGPRRPPARVAADDEDDADDAGDDDDDDDDDAGDDGDFDEYQDFLPVANEVAIEGHKKFVSALALEHTGSRLLTGSHDYSVRMYDFNGMKRDMRPFREIVPNDGYPVHALSWSPTGAQFLAVTGYPQPKIYDRDGREVGEFNKGDMYIRDLKNTKGHCSPCTSGMWHPHDNATVLTASADGSMRLWDVNYVGDSYLGSHVRGAQKSVIKPQLSRPGRVQVTSCAYSPDGGMIAGGVTDGSIQLYPSAGSASYRSASVGLVLPPTAQCHVDNNWTYASRPASVVRGAHPPGESVTSLAFSRDGNTLLSRCADGTLRVWDTRRVSRPVKTFEGLDTTHEETQVGFSPNDDFFFTGVDAPMSRADRGDGALAVFSKEKLEMVRRVGTPGNCVTALWHHRLNQVFMGCGDHKSGATRVLYDDKMSSRGMLVCVGRKARSSSNADFVNINLANISYAPHALPMFKEPMPGMKAPGDTLKAKRKDAVASKKPQAPVVGVGTGGAAGSTGGTLLTQHIMKGSDMIGEKNWRLQDPRAAILRHAEDAERNPWRTQNAYAETQPVPIFHESDDEEEDSDEE